MAAFDPQGLSNEFGIFDDQPTSEIDPTLSPYDTRSQLTSTDDSGQQTYGMPVNSNYLARVIQNGKLVAKGYVPETFTVSVNSHYSAPFGQGVAQEGALATALKVMGHTTLISQSMTMQVWTGSDPIELQLEMEFVAESDPYLEVVAPIKRLMRLAMPEKTNGVARLKPPGPQINWMDTASGAASDILQGLATQSAETAGNTLRNAIDSAAGKISIFIGNFMTFDNVVVTNVNQVFHSMFDEQGLPLRATVTISFSTFVVPAISQSNQAEDDLLRMFNGPRDDDAEYLTGQTPF